MLFRSNKDISRTNLPKKEKSNTDLSITHSIPVHSLNPLPYGEDEAAQPPERKRTEWVIDKSVFDFSFFGKLVLDISLFNCVGFSVVGLSVVGFSNIGLSAVGFSNTRCV